MRFPNQYEKDFNMGQLQLLRNYKNILRLETAFPLITNYFLVLKKVTTDLQNYSMLVN